MSRINDKVLIAQNILTNLSKFGVRKNFTAGKYLQVYKISRIDDQFSIAQNFLTNFSKLGVKENFISEKYVQVCKLVEWMTHFWKKNFDWKLVINSTNSETWRYLSEIKFCLTPSLENFVKIFCPLKNWT